MIFKNNNILCLILIYFKDFSFSLPYDNLKYKNVYGADYGTKWIYIPDGDGLPHYVNLRKPGNQDVLDVRGSVAGEIEFRLYIGNDTSTYIVLNELGEPPGNHFQNTSLKVLLSNKPLKIIIHGWKSSADKEGVMTLKDTYLESHKVNVITIDWSGIASSIFYHWVAIETKAVGASVATFISKLHEKYDVNGKQIHLIGHSLGAHIMGIAAAKSNFTIDRITGLDPARPLFEHPILEEKLEKLDSSNAEFVDIIHTCGGVLGFEADAGTVDFYPNNGIPPQPGCESLQKIFEACSHGRSFHYFSESIKYPSAFPASRCSSWSDYLENKCNTIYGYMGEHVNRNMKGKYYLKTKAYRPFGFYTPII